MDINTELAKYLDAKGIVNFDESGATGDTFIELLPATPDNAIAILSSQPAESDVKLGFDRPGIQIIVRGGQDPRPPKSKAYEIYDALHGFTSGRFVENGVWVVNCYAAQSGPIRLGQDDNGRHEFSLNFDLQVKNSTLYRE